MRLLSPITFMIQARIGSTRLPSKLLIPFFEKQSILELLIQKLKKNFPQIAIVLATSLGKENDVLEDIALEKEISLYRGEENDVLLRFIGAAKKFDKERIVRICSDNPFLDVDELSKLINYVKYDETNDYVSFNIDGIPSIKTHFGFWTEYVTLKALERVNNMTQLPVYHEHVTNYIYEHPDNFKMYFLPPNNKINSREDIRMTLDTMKDFLILSEIYKKLVDMYGENFGINKIISFIDNHSHFKTIMKTQIEENTK